MKKLISIILMISLLLSMLLISSNAREGYGLGEQFLPDEIVNLDDYNMSDEIIEYLEEDINNYFLPSAYDISPLSIVGAGLGYSGVIRDEKGKISVPPMYTSAATKEIYSGPRILSAMEIYCIYNIGNKNNMVMTDTMWRSLNQENGRSVSSVETAINAFIAPWTLYNEGKLYTWPEIMAMSDKEINELNFESYEFYTFITGVKVALESRGWWKEEYQERFDILNSHRNDYVDAQPENEILEIDGNKVYLSRLNEEYLQRSKDGNSSVNNIISANIYQPGFAEALKGVDSSVRSKYFGVINAIEEHLEFDYYQHCMELGADHYRDYTFIVPYACESSLLEIWYLLDVDDSNVKYQHMMLFAVIDECNVPKEKIREACERYNYIAGTRGVLRPETIDKIVNGTKDELVDYFKYDTSVVVSYAPIVVIPWNALRLSYDAEGTPLLEYNLEVDLCDDYQRFFNELEEIYDNSLEKDKTHIREYIDYIRELYSVPETGENTALYIAIAGGAVMAMTSLVIRRKKKIA